MHKKTRRGGAPKRRCEDVMQCDDLSCESIRVTRSRTCTTMHPLRRTLKSVTKESLTMLIDDIARLLYLDDITKRKKLITFIEKRDDLPLITLDVQKVDTSSAALTYTSLFSVACNGKTISDKTSLENMYLNYGLMNTKIVLSYETKGVELNILKDSNLDHKKAFDILQIVYGLNNGIITTPGDTLFVYLYTLYVMFPNFDILSVFKKILSNIKDKKAEAEGDKNSIDDILNMLTSMNINPSTPTIATTEIKLFLENNTKPLTKYSSVQPTDTKQALAILCANFPNAIGNMIDLMINEFSQADVAPGSKDGINTKLTTVLNGFYKNIGLGAPISSNEDLSLAADHCGGSKTRKTHIISKAPQTPKQPKKEKETLKLPKKEEKNNSSTKRQFASKKK